MLHKSGSLCLTHIIPIIANLARIVKLSGGEHVAKRIKKEAFNNLKIAVDLESRWFQDHACLFFVAHLWKSNGIYPSVLTELSGRVEPGVRDELHTLLSRTTSMEIRTSYFSWEAPRSCGGPPIKLT